MAHRSKLSNPEQFPPGPLRDYMQFLHDLWYQAGEPSSHELGRQLGCSHTTVARLFRGLPSKKKRAFQLLQYLYEHPRGRTVERTSPEWDAFDKRADTLINAAERAAETVAPDTPAKRLAAPYSEETNAAAQPSRDAAADRALPGQLERRTFREADELFRVPPRGFLHVIGPDVDQDGDEADTGISRFARLVVAGMAGMASPTFPDNVWESRVVVERHAGIAASIEAATRHSVSEVLAVYEGFHRAYVGPHGIRLVRRRNAHLSTEGVPMSMEFGFTLFDLIPMYDKAVILLAGNTYEDTLDDGPIEVNLRGPVSVPGSEAVIAEVFPPDGLSSVLERLADHLASAYEDPPVSFIMERLSGMPWVKRCVVVGPPNREELSCG